MVEYNFDYCKTEEQKQFLNRYVKDWHRTKPLEVLSIEDGIILPSKKTDESPYTWMGLGGVLDKNGNFVELSGKKHVFEDCLVFGGKYDYEEPVVESDETVIYMGPFHPHWGHFVVDHCTRLWYCVKNKNNYKIAYCGFACQEGKMVKAYEEFFELLQIDRARLIDIRRPTKFKRIIVPEQALVRSQYYTDEYKEMIDFVCNNVKMDNLVPYEKIYFTRINFVKNYKINCERGEKEIQDTFKKNGYKILAPEKLSVGEKIFYVRNCKEFAAITGSSQVSAIFGSEKQKYVFINKGFNVEPASFHCAQMTNAERVVYIDCWYKPYKKLEVTYGAGPHFIGATKEFMRFLKDNNMETLGRRTYLTAMAKTWWWLTKYIINSRSPKRISYQSIYERIKDIDSKRKKQFIIYPYGEIGKITKKVLNRRFGIREKYIVDNSLTGQKIHSIDFLGTLDMTQYYVLLACNSNAYEEVLRSAQKYALKDHIIELFPREK